MPEPPSDATSPPVTRRVRILVTAGALLSSAVVIVLLVVDADGADPLRWAAVAALVIADVAVAVLLITGGRAEAAAAARVRAATRQAGTERAVREALEVAHAATRSIAGQLDLVTVTDRCVAAAATTVAADAAVLELRVGGRLALAASCGDAGTAARGTRRDPDAVERLVLRDGDVHALGRGAAWGDGPPTLLAAVALPDRVIGLLRVRRPAGARAFTTADRVALGLVAEHAALALRTATTHDRVSQRADGLTAAFGELAEDLDLA